MKLSKKIRKKFKPNEVTTLSKGIALVLFISMPFIGFCLGRRYQKFIDTIEISRLEIEVSVLKSVNNKLDAIK